MRQDELIPGPRHRDVEQSALLTQLDLIVRVAADDVGEDCRQGQRVAPVRDREPSGDESREIDDREFEALRLVDRQDGDCVGIGVEVRGGWIVACLDQGLQMARHERRAIIREQRRLGPDDVEEPGHVAKLFLGPDRCFAGQPVERARPPQERVQDFACRTLVGDRRQLSQVRDEPADRRPRRARDPQDPRLPLELLEDLPEGPVPSPSRVHDRRQVLAAEVIRLARRDAVQVDR